MGSGGGECTKATKKHRSPGGSRKGPQYLRRYGWSRAAGWELAKSWDGKQTPGPLSHGTQPDNCWLSYLSKPNGLDEHQDSKEYEVKVEAWTLRIQPVLPDIGSENSHTQESLAKCSTPPPLRPTVCCRTLHQTKTSNKTDTLDIPRAPLKGRLSWWSGKKAKSELAHRIQHHHRPLPINYRALHPWRRVHFLLRCIRNMSQDKLHLGDHKTSLSKYKITKVCSLSTKELN